MTDWLDTLPDIDRTTILSVCNGNLNVLSQPREMNFCIYDIQDINVYREIEKSILSVHKGWITSGDSDPSDQTMLALQITDPHYIIQDGSYQRDTQFLRDLAENHGAYYDGWYAETNG